MARKHHWVSAEEDENGCFKLFSPEDYSISLHISTFRSLVNAEALAQIRRLSSPKRRVRDLLFFTPFGTWLKTEHVRRANELRRCQLQYFFTFALLVADICELSINLRSKVNGLLASAERQFANPLQCFWVAGVHLFVLDVTVFMALKELNTRSLTRNINTLYW